MTELVLSAGEHVVRAAVFADLAPGIAAALHDALPRATTLTHAKFAGEEAIAMVPFFADSENEKLDVEAGDIGYYPGRQTLCFFYGTTKPFGPVSHVGRVSAAGLSALKELGRLAFEKGAIPVRLEIS